MTGLELSRRWSVKCEHALYNKSGTWYHQLERFPGALFDEHGYVLFPTKEDFLNSPYLRIVQDVHVPQSLQAMDGYVRMKGAKVTHVEWNRNELLIALNLYHKVAFGKFHAKNKMLVEISERMGRKPSALPMKLSNLASIDPEFRKPGRKGLEGASEFDRAMWAEYYANLNELAPESEELLAQLMTGQPEASIDVQSDGRVLRMPEGLTEGTASVKVRRGQQYFRQAVLNAYQGRCAITGLAVRDLLVASHIIPWRTSEEHRLDPRNGIALNALHDKAFDRGLISFDTDLKLVCSPLLRVHFADSTIAQSFKAYEGRPLTSPKASAGPNAEFLFWHRTHYGFTDPTRA
jgi:putative restriction endonuclease